MLNFSAGTTGIKDLKSYQMDCDKHRTFSMVYLFRSASAKSAETRRVMAGKVYMRVRFDDKADCSKTGIALF